MPPLEGSRPSAGSSCSSVFEGRQHASFQKAETSLVPFHIRRFSATLVGKRSAREGDVATLQTCTYPIREDCVVRADRI
jgi:hypothetical protein